MFKSSADEEYAKTDHQTYCKAGGVDEVTVILIDHTDDFNTVQQSRLGDLLLQIATSIPKNSKIELYNVRPVTETLLKPVFSLCNPGDGSDVNALTGNKGFAKKAYEEKFKKQLQNSLSEVFGGDTANVSPIMEALQSVNVSSLLGENASASSKNLIIVSDFLQHTKNFSLYQPIPDFIAFKNGAYFSSVRSDLHGVHVDMYYLRRDGQMNSQTEKLRDFWFSFFKEQGARLGQFSHVPG